MAKKTHPLEPVITELGKDIALIANTLADISQKSIQAGNTRSEEQNTGVITDINAVLAALQKYQVYAKAEAAVKDSFLPFLGESISDYQLSDEQKQALYAQMCQHLWEIRLPEHHTGGLTELPVPTQYQGKFGYIISVGGDATNVTYTLLTDKVEVNILPYLTRAYSYLVIPDLSGKEAEVISVAPKPAERRGAIARA